MTCKLFSTLKRNSVLNGRLLRFEARGAQEEQKQNKAAEKQEKTIQCDKLKGKVHRETIIPF